MWKERLSFCINYRKNYILCVLQDNFINKFFLEHVQIWMKLTQISTKPIYIYMDLVTYGSPKLIIAQNWPTFHNLWPWQLNHLDTPIMKSTSRVSWTCLIWLFFLTRHLCFSDGWLSTNPRMDTKKIDCTTYLEFVKHSKFNWQY